MRLLVTGGAGFIGSHYVRTLLGEAWGLEAPAQVVVLDKFTYAGNIENLTPVLRDQRLEVVEGDILDPVLVGELMARVDAVVHFAAESHVDRSILGAADFVMTNVVGTQTLLEAAREHGVAKFVHVSTDEVYGSIESGSWTEDEPLLPNSPYSASKAGSDLMARSYFRTHNLPVCITRCSNNYGPYQFPEKVIPLFVTNLVDGLPVPLYGEGLNRPRLAARRRPLPGDPPGADRRTVRGDLQHRRRHRAQQHASSPACCSRRPARAGTWSSRCPTGSGTTCATPSTTPRSATSSATSRRSPSSRASRTTVDWYRTQRGWWEPLKERARLSR